MWWNEEEKVFEHLYGPKGKGFRDLSDFKAYGRNYVTIHGEMDIYIDGQKASDSQYPNPMQTQ